MRPTLLPLLCLALGTSSSAVAGCRRSTPDEPLPRPLPATSPVPAPSNDAAGAGMSREVSREADASLAPSLPSMPDVPPLPDVRTDWCLEGWRGLDEGTCYLVPDGWDARGARRLLVYLSGIVPPVAKSPQQVNVQRVVAAAAKRAGAVVLLPRGRRGIGPAGAKDWWAWPTGAGDYAAHAGVLVAEWSTARSKLEARLGRFDRVYVAGSSSGAYFLTTLAFARAVEMDGYAALSGGAPGFAAARASAAVRRPFYVGYASGDTTNRGPKALGAFLASAGWPVRVAEHPGGHGAREVYLDEAFAFWDAFERDAGPP